MPTKTKTPKEKASRTTHADRHIIVPHTKLQQHKSNMRRRYPQANVAEMANSIRKRGVLEPLIVVRTRKRGYYIVVIGNLRLTALQLLGDKAPMVGVIVRHLSKLDQLLDMGDENLVRFKPDAISQALHFRDLMEKYKLTKQNLQERLGVSSSVIHSRLLLLDLPQEVQELIAEGDLPKSIDAVKSLLSLPEKAMIRAAKRLAERGADIRMIQGTCRSVLLSLNKRKALSKRKPGTGARAINANAVPAIGLVTDAGNVPQHAAEAIKHTCKACPMHGDPRNIQTICNECPLTDFVRRLTQSADKVGA